MLYCYLRLVAYTKVMRWITTKENDMNSLTTLVIAVWVVGAWLTHIVHCITEEVWGFLIAGAIFFPIAVVHGTGLWLGIW
jgi:hypothetical protein